MRRSTTLPTWCGFWTRRGDSGEKPPAPLVPCPLPCKLSGRGPSYPFPMRVLPHVLKLLLVLCLVGAVAWFHSENRRLRGRAVMLDRQVAKRDTNLVQKEQEPVGVIYKAVGFGEGELNEIATLVEFIL